MSVPESLRDRSFGRAVMWQTTAGVCILVTGTLVWNCISKCRVVESFNAETVIWLKPGMREYGLGWFSQNRAGRQVRKCELQITNLLNLLSILHSIVQIMNLFSTLADFITSTTGNCVIICQHGRTRSAAVVCAYFLKYWSFDTPKWVNLPYKVVAYLALFIWLLHYSLAPRCLVYLKHKLNEQMCHRGSSYR